MVFSGYLFKVYASFRNEVSKAYSKLSDWAPPIVAGVLTAASLTPQSIPAGFAVVNQIVSKSLPVKSAAFFFVSFLCYFKKTSYYFIAFVVV